MNTSAQNDTDTKTSNGDEFFNLTTQGTGRVWDAHWVPHGGGKSLAVVISAFRGPRTNLKFTKYNLYVTGEKAKKLVRRMTNAVNEGRTVLVGFEIGDTYPDLFTHKKGEKKGQIGVTTRGHLLQIFWVQVDGKKVYSLKAERQKAAEREPANGDEQSPAAPGQLASGDGEEQQAPAARTQGPAAA